MRNIYSKVSLAVAVLLLVPQVAFAAWWNPLSWSVWSIFIPTHKVQQVQNNPVAEATSTPEKPAASDPETTLENTSSKIAAPKPSAQTNTAPAVEKAPAVVAQPTQPAQNNNEVKISSGALEGEMMRFLNVQLSQQIKSDLDYYQKTISGLQNTYQMIADIFAKGKQNCLASYNSKVEYAKSDAQRQTTAYQESQRGFATQPGISKGIADQLAIDLDSIDSWYASCLAKYQTDTSLISAELGHASNQLNGLQQRINSGGTVSPSEVSSLGNELLSIAKAQAAIAGVSASLSLPSIGSQASSVTCTNDITGFSCRDNLGSNTMRCTQTTPGFLNCTDSNSNRISCQANSTIGSVRCSW